MKIRRRLLRTVIAAWAATAGLAACAPAPAAGPSPIFALASAATTGSLIVRLPIRAERRLQATAADVDYVRITVQAGPVLQEAIVHYTAGGSAPAQAFAGIPVGIARVRAEAFGRSGRVVGQRAVEVAIAAGGTASVQIQIPLMHNVPDPRFSFGEAGCGAAPGAGTGSIGTAITLADAVPVRVPTVMARHMADLPDAPIVDVALHADGAVWLTGGPNWRYEQFDSPNPVNTFGQIYRLPAGGQLEDLTPPRDPSWPEFGGDPIGFIPGEIDMSSPSGAVVVENQYGAYMGSSYLDGTFIMFDDARQRLGYGRKPEVAGFEFKDADHYWTNESHRIGSTTVYERNIVTASLVLTPQPPHGLPPFATFHTMPETMMPSTILRDRAGHVWAYGQESTAMDVWKGWIRRLDPAGNLVAEVDVPCHGVTEIALDSQNNAWFPDFAGDQVVKLSPTGSPLAVGRSALRADRVFVDAYDHVWAYQGWRLYDGSSVPHDPNNASPYVARYAPDGTLLAYYHVGTDVSITRLVVTPTGKMWVGTLEHGLIGLDVDVPFVP